MTPDGIVSDCLLCAIIIHVCAIMDSSLRSQPSSSQRPNIKPHVSYTLPFLLSSFIPSFLHSFIRGQPFCPSHEVHSPSMIRRSKLRQHLHPSSLGQITSFHSGSFSCQNKVTSVDDAISLVRSHNTISVSGFVAQGSPETLLRGLGDHFRTTGHPRNLKLVFGGGPGDYGTKGLNHLAQPGMLKRVVGSHYGQVPLIASMALNNDIEAYCMPLGSISRMLRAAASASPGHITKVGLGTFIDPDQTGGRLNAKSTKNIVERISILGDEYLCYKAIPINVAIIRATTGDTEGNLSFERESLYSDARVIAMVRKLTGSLISRK